MKMEESNHSFNESISCTRKMKAEEKIKDKKANSDSIAEVLN